ncbi:hemicentin-1-like isoform X2 [Lineus longissimus]|uniref:hemicentin-1-like isoform X2 n=1 Tax=Lineus longissimus TaxID=88925 RepID=UPI002B4EAC5A
MEMYSSDGATQCCRLVKINPTCGLVVKTFFLILMSSHHVHATLTSAVLTILPNSTVLNNTEVHFDCDYEPTDETIKALVYLENNAQIYAYEKSTSKNESLGVFMGRAQLFLLSPGKFRMTVDQVSTKDQLAVQCQVYGQSITNSKLSAEVNLHVNAIPQMLSFTASPVMPTVENSTVNLTCEANLGRPDGTIKWKKDVGGNVTDLTGTQVSETDNGDNTKTRSEKYQITNAKPEENGSIYTCEVNNTAITAGPVPSADINLIVQYTTRNLSISHSGDTVVTPLDITCSARGNPTPEMSWVKVSGEDLKHTAGVLHVPASTYNGTYVYECFANNSVSGVPTVLQETKEFSVFGYCHITTETQKVYVTENSTTSIMCRINGTERPTWSKEGATKTFDCESRDPKYSIACVKQKYYNLTFTADWSYRGSYSCECFLEKKIVEVVVNVSPRSINTSCKIHAGKDTEKNCIDTQIGDNDELTITTEVSCAHPVPSITWKNGQDAINISTFNPVTLQTACSHGAFKGQTSVSQVFHAKWIELGRAMVLTLNVTNDAISTKIQLKISEKTLTTAMIGMIAGIAVGVIVVVGIIITVVIVKTKGKCVAATSSKGSSTFETFKSDHKVANNKNMVDIIRKPYPEPVFEKNPPSPDEESEKYEMSPLTHPE